LGRVGGGGAGRPAPPLPARGRPARGGGGGGGAPRQKHGSRQEDTICGMRIGKNKIRK
jgi:hypothetical protein